MKVDLTLNSPKFSAGLEINSPKFSVNFELQDVETHWNNNERFVYKFPFKFKLLNLRFPFKLPFKF